MQIKFRYEIPNSSSHIYINENMHNTKLYINDFLVPAVFSGTLRMTDNFTPELADQNSAQYQALASSIEQEVNSLSPPVCLSLLKY
jgi:hypothetical protein